MTSVTDPLGVISQFTYDELGRVTATTEAVGTSVQRTSSAQYNAAGDLIQTVNPRGVAIDYAYDTAGRLTLTTGAQSFSLIQTYNSRDQVISITAAGIRTTAYQYDLLGQITAVTESRRYLCGADHEFYLRLGW